MPPNRITTSRTDSSGSVAAAGAGSDSRYATATDDFMSAPVQIGFDVADHVEQTRPDLVLQLRAREVKHRRAAVEGEHAGAVGGHQRHADGVDVRLPLARRNGEAATLDAFHRALDAGLHLRPLLAF